MPSLERVKIISSSGDPYSGRGKKFVSVNCDNVGWHNAGFIEDVKANWPQYREDIELAETECEAQVKALEIEYGDAVQAVKDEYERRKKVIEAGRVSATQKAGITDGMDALRDWFASSLEAIDTKYPTTP